MLPLRSWSLDTGHATEAMRLAAALTRFWRTRGYLSEARRWFAQVLEADDAAPAILVTGYRPCHRSDAAGGRANPLLAHARLSQRSAPLVRASPGGRRCCPCDLGHWIPAMPPKRCGWRPR